MKISAVIPTRNRLDSLTRLLQSLGLQTRPLDEIVIVDASDDRNSEDIVRKEFSKLPIVWIESIPSVCIQRNIGVYAATGNWIFLCDDDIELCADYVATLESYGKNNSTCGAITGKVLQWEGRWVENYRVETFGKLLWRFIFQHSVWGDVSSIKALFLLRPLLFLIQRFYYKRGNSFSLAGWPLVTDWRGKVFKAAVFSLGANLIRKDWLVKSPYDEVLDPAGIGDNYGVAIGFPGEMPIHVISSVFAYHHRAKENRLPHTLIYYRRVLALHYFIKGSERFSSLTRVTFIWSLLGNAIGFFLKRHIEMCMITCKAIVLIIGRRNPYCKANGRNQKMVQPLFCRRQIDSVLSSFIPFF